MKDKSKISHYKAEANAPKNRLIEIEDKLRNCGAIKEADQLSKIIGKLEAWQNR